MVSGVERIEEWVGEALSALPARASARSIRRYGRWARVLGLTVQRIPSSTRSFGSGIAELAPGWGRKGLYGDLRADHSSR